MNRGRSQSKDACMPPSMTQQSEFRDAYPAPLFVRAKRRSDHAADLQAVTKSRKYRSSSLDRLQEIARLDDDLIAVSGPVSGPLAEGAKIRVFGRREQLGEAAAPAGHTRIIEP